ncbi:MAG: hypothetical protein JW749_00630 [Sedimentisphaerales bacterium]|nr:hypothetical protein [Sedimentisphaerales bacterium]
MAAKVTIPIPEWLDRICTWPVMVYRKHKKGWPYRRIYLGNGKWTIVEPQDYYWLKEFNWYVGGNGKEFYAFTNIVTSQGKTRMTSMHRLIMDPPRNLLVDHRNNKTLDNRRANLRPATHSENACNRPKISSKTSSRYIGVYYEKSTGKWTAKIRVNGRRLWLGRFDSEIEAARAYDRAAIKYHGEFARLNFPREDYLDEFPLSK